MAIIVQINGKLRDTIQVQTSTIKLQDEIEESAKTSEKIKKHLEGQTVKKVIYLEGKLLNFVI